MERLSFYTHQPTQATSCFPFLDIAVDSFAISTTNRNFRSFHGSFTVTINNEMFFFPHSRSIYG